MYEGSVSLPLRCCCALFCAFSVIKKCDHCLPTCGCCFLFSAGLAFAVVWGCSVLDRHSCAGRQAVHRVSECLDFVITYAGCSVKSTACHDYAEAFWLLHRKLIGKSGDELQCSVCREKPGMLDIVAVTADNPLFWRSTRLPSSSIPQPVYAVNKHAGECNADNLTVAVTYPCAQTPQSLEQYDR